MTPERWQQITAIFQAALAHPPAGRAAFLVEACGADATLRSEVDAMLAAESHAGNFGDASMLAFAGEGRRFEPGTPFGPYRIETLIAAGGMGEVYRARDTKLGRDVAIKMLPQAFSSDPERLARFGREARVLATLNHPHIGAIYGLEEADGVRGLVLELVEGPTLADRLKGGPLSVSEAVTLARQIADALEAAHEQGIIHRDLKPANIKVRTDSTVKVLDFGLAKALETNPVRSDLSQSPTITTPAATRMGVILGTAAYMSPEQAKGKPVDKRSDVWAFGAVLYEMLTGTRAFEGADVQDTFVAIMQNEPVWARLPATLPLALGTYLRRCLHKNPKQRIPDIATMRLALEGAFETTAPLTTAPATVPHGRLAWVAAGVAAALAAAMAIPTVRHLRPTPTPSSPETRTDIVTPTTDSPASFALSPDGRQIVFVASGDGASRLWLRSLSTTTAQPLAGTEGATFPFWSPDSRSMGFFAEGALKRLDLGGGAPQTLAPVTVGQGGTWNTDGVLVFAPSVTSSLMRVSATGGAVLAVTTLGPKQQGHIAPSFLPDGRRFVFYALGVGGPDTTGPYLGALDGSAPTRLTPADSPGVYLPAGWLLWVRAGTLVAQRLDVAKAALTGEPVTLADGVGAVSVAAMGLVAYRTGAGRQRQLIWVDRSGTARGTVGDPDGTLSTPRVSPDGRRVAVGRSVKGNTDVWLLDGARMSRFTFDAAVDHFPVWSPDGTRIAFSSNRTEQYDLYQKLTSGAGVEERLVASGQIKTPWSWSADGRFLLYTSIDPQTDADLWVVPMAGALRQAQGGPSESRADRTPSVFLKTPFRETYGAFSPDGRWVAYQSNESGRPEIYVRPFVPPGAAGPEPGATGGQWQVSTAGGTFPAWRPDGKELYYLNPAGAMMAASITVTGSTLDPGAPAVLFPTHIVGGGVDAQQLRQYDVAPDGRFLINTQLDSAAAPITLIQNWNPEAQK